MTTDYVLGFAFDDVCENVVLIRKIRPPWQKGLLNGIGGHVEETDIHFHAAMVREFQEETGLLVERWDHFVTLGRENDFLCACFRAFGVPLDEIQTMTDETVKVFPVHNLSVGIVSNLRWLIPLALDLEPYPFHVDYR